MTQRRWLSMVACACVFSFAFSFTVAATEDLMATDGGGNPCVCFYECPGIGLVVSGKMVNGHWERCADCRLPD